MCHVCDSYEDEKELDVVIINKEFISGMKSLADFEKETFRGYNRSCEEEQELQLHYSWLCSHFFRMIIKETLPDKYNKINYCPFCGRKLD